MKHKKGKTFLSEEASFISLSEVRDRAKAPVLRRTDPGRGNSLSPTWLGECSTAL